MKKLITAIIFIFCTTYLSAVELSKPTRALNGTNITYNYTSDRSYNVNC